jgi:hypothetical protein
MFVRGTQGWRLLLAWWLIAQQLWVGAGVSLPHLVAVAGSAERYPCEHCGCGCRTAEDCWRNCCCFTDSQKVAWARRHAVAIPSFVAIAARRAAAAADQPPCAHCVAETGTVDEGRLTTDHGAADGQTERDTTDRRWPWRSISAARCQGLAAYTMLAGPHWPGNPPLPMLAPPRATDRFTPDASTRYSPSLAAPPTPPP